MTVCQDRASRPRAGRGEDWHVRVHEISPHIARKVTGPWAHNCSLRERFHFESKPDPFPLVGPCLCLAPNNGVEKGISREIYRTRILHTVCICGPYIQWYGCLCGGMPRHNLAVDLGWQKLWLASVFEMKLASPHMPDHLSVRLRNSSLYQYAIIRRSCREAFNFAIRRLVSSGNELPFSLIGPLHGVRVPVS